MDGQDGQDKGATACLLFRITRLVGLDALAEAQRRREKHKRNHEKREKHERKAGRTRGFAPTEDAEGRRRKRFLITWMDRIDRQSIEAGVSSVSWTARTQVLE